MVVKITINKLDFTMELKPILFTITIPIIKNNARNSLSLLSKYIDLRTSQIYDKHNVEIPINNIIYIIPIIFFKKLPAKNSDISKMSYAINFLYIFFIRSINKIVIILARIIVIVALKALFNRRLFGIPNIILFITKIIISAIASVRQIFLATN